MGKDKTLTAKEAALIKPLIAKKIKGIDFVLLEKGPNMDKEKKADLEARLNDLRQLYRQLYAATPEKREPENFLKKIIRQFLKKQSL